MGLMMLSVFIGSQSSTCCVAGVCGLEKPIPRAFSRLTNRIGTPAFGLTATAMLLGRESSLRLEFERFRLDLPAPGPAQAGEHAHAGAERCERFAHDRALIESIDERLKRDPPAPTGLAWLGLAWLAHSLSRSVEE